MDYSGRLNSELNAEDASLWYVTVEQSSKIMFKIPTTSIKAVYKGCKVLFLYGKDITPKTTYFHTGISVFDNLTNELNVFGLDRFEEEHKSLWKIMQEEKTFVEFYNELGVCFMHGFVKFSELDRRKVLELLGDINNLYCGNMDAAANLSLDSFEYTLNPSQQIILEKITNILKIEGQFSELTTVTNHFIGLNESNEIYINDEDEGGSFEKQIWVLFDNFFQYDLYKNPQVKYKNKEREFTDILAFYEYGIFLVETKTIAIVTLEKDQTIDRRINNVQKQISKAIDQLLGANKVLAQDLQIFDNKGREITFNKKIIPHCIVLVSELVPFGDWTDIEKQIELAMVNGDILLNVFELIDFMKFIKVSKGKKEIFDYHLMKRAEAFMQQKSVFLKAKFI